MCEIHLLILRDELLASPSSDEDEDEDDNNKQRRESIIRQAPRRVENWIQLEPTIQSHLDEARRQLGNGGGTVLSEEIDRVTRGVQEAWDRCKITVGVVLALLLRKGLLVWAQNDVPSG